MAVLLEAPYSQFFDDNGNPLTGGLVYTYSAGTTTPKATYTDYTGTVQAANPVVLDSAGRAAIWCVGSYRMDVKTSAGVLIKSTDNYTAPNANGDMASSIYDPALIQQQVVGTTAVQTITNKTFDGTSVGATQASGDNSTKLATTAYADAVSSTKNNTSAVSVTNNITPANIPGLTWVLDVGTYSVDFATYITCNTAGGLKFGGAFTGTATGKLFLMQGLNGASPINIPTTTTPFTAYGTTGVTAATFIGRMVFTVTVAGTFTMQFSQASSNAAASAIADGNFSATVRKV